MLALAKRFSKKVQYVLFPLPKNINVALDVVNSNPSLDNVTAYYSVCSFKY